MAREVIEAVRETCPDSLLKVILETGELRTPPPSAPPPTSRSRPGPTS